MLMFLIFSFFSIFCQQFSNCLTQIHFFIIYYYNILFIPFALTINRNDRCFQIPFRVCSDFSFPSVYLYKIIHDLSYVKLTFISVFEFFRPINGRQSLDFLELCFDTLPLYLEIKMQQRVEINISNTTLSLPKVTIFFVFIVKAIQIIKEHPRQLDFGILIQ